jgi:phage repressor protein C with HTH and peptisase S24 domain
VVELPSSQEDGTYALEVSGDSMLPLYRDGDVVVVSPTAQMRRGDRVVVRTKGGEVLVKVLYRQTPKTVELHSLNPAHAPRTIEVQDIEGMGRIVWASQ